MAAVDQEKFLEAAQQLQQGSEKPELQLQLEANILAVVSGVVDKIKTTFGLESSDEVLPEENTQELFETIVGNDFLALLRQYVLTSPELEEDFNEIASLFASQKPEDITDEQTWIAKRNQGVERFARFAFTLLSKMRGQDIQALITVQNELVQFIQTKNGAIETLSGNVQTLNEELSSVKSERDGLQTSLTQVQKELDELKGKAPETVTVEDTAKIEALQKEKIELEGRIKTLSSSKNNWKKLAKDLNQGKKDAELARDSAEAKAESAKESLKNSKKAIKNFLGLRDGVVNNLRNGLDDAKRAKLLAIQTQLKNPEQRKAGLNELSQILGADNDLGTKINALQIGISELFSDDSEKAVVENFISELSSFLDQALAPQGSEEQTQQIQEQAAKIAELEAKNKALEEEQEKIRDAINELGSVLAQMQEIIKRFNKPRWDQMVAEGSALATALSDEDLVEAKKSEAYKATIKKLDDYFSPAKVAEREQQAANTNNRDYWYEQRVAERMVANGGIAQGQAETHSRIDRVAGAVWGGVKTVANGASDIWTDRKESKSGKRVAEDFSRFANANNVHEDAQISVRSFLWNGRLEGLSGTKEIEAKNIVERLRDDKRLIPFVDKKLSNQEKDHLWKQLVDLCDVKKDERELIESVQNVLNARNIDPMVQENIVSFVKRGFRENGLLFPNHRRLFQALKDSEPRLREAMIRNIVKTFDRNQVSLPRNEFELNDQFVVRMLGIPRNLWYVDQSRFIPETLFPTIETPLFVLNGDNVEDTTHVTWGTQESLRVTGLYTDDTGRKFGVVEKAGVQYLFPYYKDCVSSTQNTDLSINPARSLNQSSTQKFFANIQSKKLAQAESFAQECAELIRQQANILDIWGAQEELVQNNQQRSEHLAQVLSHAIQSMRSLSGALGVQGILENYIGEIIQQAQRRN